MARIPSAAASIYPNLRSSDQAPRQAQRTGSLAESMYPRPKPDPHQVWRDHVLELAGLRKVKDKR